MIPNTRIYVIKHNPDLDNPEIDLGGNFNYCKVFAGAAADEKIRIYAKHRKDAGGYTHAEALRIVDRGPRLTLNDLPQFDCRAIPYAFIDCTPQQ